MGIFKELRGTFGSKPHEFKANEDEIGRLERIAKESSIPGVNDQIKFLDSIARLNPEQAAIVYKTPNEELFPAIKIDARERLAHLKGGK